MSLFSADQLVAHAAGDYLIQSDWMANKKTTRSAPALLHALSYALPFLLLTRSRWALAAIVTTHFVIDRWRLARFVVWVKNLLAPASWRFPWRACKGTGYYENRPPWLAVWLLIVADNLMHVTINALALRYWGAP